MGKRATRDRRSVPERFRRLGRPHAPGVWPCGLALVSLLLPALTRAQTPERPTVSASLPADGFVDPMSEVRLTLSRPLETGERVAVVLGDQDVSSLFYGTATSLTYQPSAFPMPSGKGELTVFLVRDDGGWTQIGRFELQVRGALGYEQRDFRPALQLGLKGQPAAGQDPTEPPPTRERFSDFDGEFRVGLEQLHRDFALFGNANVVGTSYQNNALRYQRQGDEAPLVDLASYDTGIRGDPASLTVGHVRYGDHRHLTNSLAARGARLDLSGGRVDATVAAASGTQVVGWENLLGVTDPDHRIFSANVGIEALETPGALRLDAGWMNGSVQPQSSFNQGVVNDAEKSDGYSLRLRANALDRRLRLDAGFSESRFDNPEDSLLSQGLDLVPVRETRNNARYLDADLDVLRGVSLGGSTRARLSVGYRHERVDPLYRSVGAYAQSDRLNNRFDVRADIAWVTVAGSHGEARDNLNDVPSVLTSKTRRTDLTLGLPLTRANRWLPRAQYRLGRTHQFGEGVPTNGGFDESHIPDQVSLNHTVGLDWQWDIVTVGLQLNRSDQDNRQPGRENADFVTGRNSLRVGVMPLSSLSLGFDLALERRDNKAAEQIADTRRWGIRASWQVLRGSSLSLNYSDTFQDDSTRTFERGNRILDVGWTSFVPFMEEFGGQYFVRFNHQDNSSKDLLRDTAFDMSSWTLNFGLGLTLGRR